MTRTPLRPVRFQWLRPLQEWWRADRIRISPREGRILCIEAPCILEIEGERWLVESREPFRDAQGPGIEYRCRNERDLESEIRAYPSPGAKSPTRVLWARRDGIRRLDETEVGIYPLSQDRRIG